jgi:hypothetical protein
VYIYGGRAGVDMAETTMADMWKLELNSSAKWTEVEQGADVPEKRSFHKMIAVGTDLYMFGGVGSNGRLNDLWKFDTVNEKWSGLGSSLLRGRGGPNILSLSGSKIAIVAGFVSFLVLFIKNVSVLIELKTLRYLSQAGEETNDGHIYAESGWESNVMNGLGDLRKRSVCCFGSFPDFSFVFGGEGEIFIAFECLFI